MDVPKYTITSTSPQSAVVDDVVLRDGAMTRLVFRPELVDNNNDPKAAVRGHLLFQKKGKNDEWDDWKDVPLNTLKKGEGVAFELRSAELRRLYDELQKLYELHQAHGVPMGVTTFIEAKPSLEKLAHLPDDELDALADADAGIGGEVLVKLLKWASAQSDPSMLVQALGDLSQEQLQSMSALAGIATLKNAVDIWNKAVSNWDHPAVGKEETWQKIFVKHQFLIEHLFAYPVAVVAEKAYVGGKSVFNSGGNLVDFLLKNSLTSNVVLLEIKTPRTPLLGKEYRTGVFNMSAELTGSVLQVLDYRASFTKEVLGLSGKSGTTMDAADPPCQVIIGNAAELDTEDKRKSFELFRRQFPGVGITTYDEVFARAKQLLALLQAM